MGIDQNLIPLTHQKWHNLHRYAYYIEAFSKVQVSIWLLENSGVCLATMKNVSVNDKNDMPEYSLLE